MASDIVCKCGKVMEFVKSDELVRNGSSGTTASPVSTVYGSAAPPGSEKSCIETYRCTSCGSEKDIFIGPH
jgi:hypothetical protein